MAVDKKTSDCLYVLKFFAILSVISAHMPFTENFPLSENIRNTFGQIGVVIFFILSGFFYKRQKGDSADFFKKKIKTVVIPWIVCAVFTFGVSVVLNRNFGALPVRLIKWILGIGNWYWYITVLLVIFVLFKFINKDFLLYVCIAVTVLSVMLSAFGKVPYNSYFNPYLNIFNWIGFFAMGILLRKHNIISKFINIPTMCLGAVLLTVGFYLSAGLSEVKAYINYYSIITEIGGTILFLNISYLLSSIKLLRDIGKKSYLIYLIHMQIAGIINTRLPYNTLFFILRPLLVLSVVYIIVKVTEAIIENTGLKKYGYIIALGK